MDATNPGGLSATGNHPASYPGYPISMKIMGQSMGKLKKYMATSWEKIVKSHAKYGDL
jgi:alkylated DNA nucleotide flippase Atl1